MNADERSVAREVLFFDLGIDEAKSPDADLDALITAHYAGGIEQFRIDHSEAIAEVLR